MLDQHLQVVVYQSLFHVYYPYDSNDIFIDTVIQTLEIDATLETQVGKHEFCW